MWRPKNQSDNNNCTKNKQIIIFYEKNGQKTITHITNEAIYGIIYKGVDMLILKNTKKHHNINNLKNFKYK